MNRIHKLLAVFALSGALAVLDGCGIKYSFTGANIPLAAQTFSVGFFVNNAPGGGSPTLSNTFTEALKDRFMRQTRLSQVPENGDLSFEGEITGWAETPASVSAASEQADRYRLTITVQVRFNNVLEPEWSFPSGKSFSAFEDYDFTATVDQGLVDDIIEALVDNIFNASVANW